MIKTVLDTCECGIKKIKQNILPFQLNKKKYNYKCRRCGLVVDESK